MPPALLLQDITLTFGATPLLAGAGLSVAGGERICLVGRNGCGKSTLLRIAAGLLAADGGRRFVQPGTTIRYLPQEPDFAGFASTAAYVAAGFAGDPDSHRVATLLDALGLHAAADPALLSGGEARRAALARVLAPVPDILLLDEPTNHLDLPGIEWLERQLAAVRAGVVLISHDRRLLERLSRRTVWLDRGVTRTLDQGFAGFEAWRDTVLAEEAAARHRLGRKIAMEEDWLRYGVTARRKRNQKRLAGLHALRQQHREQRAAVGNVRLAASTAGLSGRQVIVAEGVSKVFGARPIVRDFTIRILRGDRVGIVGGNGCGKTTLLGLLTGTLAADAGCVQRGTNLAQITLDQRRDTLDPAQTLRTALAGNGDTVTVGGTARHVIGYMQDFLFTPEQANTPVGVLSGGERGRLVLAAALARPSNLLVLDEPTNDLDLETLDLLQERLAEYDGTVLLVSHDRDFLDRVATLVIAAEGEGRWVAYAGGYSDMLAQRAAAPAPARRSAITPPTRPPRPPAAAPPPPRAGRQPYRDRHALAALPARMAALTAEIARLAAVLSDPDFYRRDAAGFAAASTALAAAQHHLADAEDQWLTLEMQREAAEG